MKKLLLTAALLLSTGLTHLHAQCPMSGHQAPCPQQWTLQRSWANGLDAMPDVCTNLHEFYSQYHKNQAQWDAAFKWLATHDLVGMKAGSYPIEGSNLSANVQDGTNQPLEKGGSESHYKKIDLQYVVSGRERFGLLDHETSYPNCGYKPDVIHYDYDREKTMYITSSPHRFFLFFPSDWHIAWLKTDGATDKARVVVIKLDYVK